MAEMAKNKTDLEKGRKRLDKLLKRKNGLDRSDSIDFEALDQLMLENSTNQEKK